ncbi:anion transporter [Paludisphaera sp.]|uniref:anion transporter n=1 Tax=Paludisphaera sp. TaxID=2017432 RepID=UPI00301DF8E9
MDGGGPWIASAIFAAVYAALAIGNVPGLRLDRATIAMAGAAAMLATGVMDLGEAAGSVDAGTIVLLYAMMILSGRLRLAGLFDAAVEAVATRRPGPKATLAIVVGMSGVLSAFFVNDVVCVALTPLIVGLCRRLGRPAVPYLIALATASNVGSTATITGNPQNMIIGSLSGISYARFAARLGPVAIAGLGLTYLIVATVYRKALREQSPPRPGPPPLRRSRARTGLLVRSVIVAAATVAAFFAGVPAPVAALAGAAALTLDRARPARDHESVDWPLLVMFAGLFAVVHGFEANVARRWDFSRWIGDGSPVAPVSLASVFLSNLVSNVPAVLLFEPIIAGVSDREAGWLALAMSSTLAGNLTLLGSVANLIVAEGARRDGERLGFLEFLKVGVPLTIATVGVGVAWLTLTAY